MGTRWGGSLQDRLAPASGACIVGGRGGEGEGGVGLGEEGREGGRRGEQGFLAVRVVRMVLSPRQVGPSSGSPSYLHSELYLRETQPGVFSEPPCEILTVRDAPEKEDVINVFGFFWLKAGKVTLEGVILVEDAHIA